MLKRKGRCKEMRNVLNEAAPFRTAGVVKAKRDLSESRAPAGQACYCPGGVATASGDAGGASSTTSAGGL